jgi:hypothetical protein
MISYKEAQDMGFVERSYRPWTMDAEFFTKLFSKKYLDLFQKRGKDLVYLATIIQKQ